MREAGHVRASLDPDAAASVLLAVMEGLQVQWLYQPDVDMPKVLDQFLYDYLGPGVDVDLDSLSQNGTAPTSQPPS